MSNKWTIELKLNKGEFFYTAEPKTDMLHIINKKVQDLTAKIASLETEMILTNLSEEAFINLKEQIRCEAKKRYGALENYTDYNVHNNKRAY